MKADISNFRLPRYREVPNIGLYRDQTIKYLNVILQPLGCIETTPSMVSNYVKKGYISKPQKKLYSERQIALLLMIMVAKLVLSMDNIEILLRRQGMGEDFPAVYNHFCVAFESSLRATFGLQDDPENASGATEPPAGPGAPRSGDAELLDKLLRSVITTASNTIYINHCFEMMKD